MFNGIIYKTGKIVKIIKENNYSDIVLKTNYKFKKSEIGSSLCCNGTCLTITKIQNNYISFYLSKETLKRTTFGSAKVAAANATINLASATLCFGFALCSRDSKIRWNLTISVPFCCYASQADAVQQFASTSINRIVVFDEVPKTP